MFRCLVMFLRFGSNYVFGFNIGLASPCGSTLENQRYWWLQSKIFDDRHSRVLSQSVGKKQITPPKEAKVKSYMEVLLCEIAEEQSHSPSRHTTEAPYLEGVSLRIQDLTDNLWGVLHDVPANSQLLMCLKGMVHITAWFVAIYSRTIPIDMKTACVWR